MSAKAAAVNIDIPTYMQAVGVRARAAARETARADSGRKDAALKAIATAIENAAPALKTENDKDMAAGRQRGLDAALLDRLELTDARIALMAEGLREIALLPDPATAQSRAGLPPSMRSGHH